MHTRRATLSTAVGLMAAACTARTQAALPQEDFAARLRLLEEQAAGELGAFVIDTGTGETLGWRADQRFCHCSTFKFSLAAFALRESDAGRVDLTEKITFSNSDLVSYSPIVEQNIAVGEMSIAALAEAAQVTSDNTAANLLMRRLGGPEAMTQFWRGLGDKVSQIDGYEPEINIIPPATQENSTSAKAMAYTLKSIVLGDVLSPQSRQLLVGWMRATRTGKRRIRAGLPTNWEGLDKTGSGIHEEAGNKTNDISVLLPPDGRAPLVVTGFFQTREYSPRIRAQDEMVLKKLGELAVDWERTTRL